MVRDPAAHRAILARALAQVDDLGLSVLAATASPLTGPEGNREFFLHLLNAPGRSVDIDIDAVVAPVPADQRHPRERLNAR